MPLNKVVVPSTQNSTDSLATHNRDLLDDCSTAKDEEVVYVSRQPDNESSQLEGSVSLPLLSAASTLSKKGSISSQDICRICHCEAEIEAPLVAPCSCAGSLKFVHQGCLQRWVQSSDMKNCELCKYPFIMQTKIKPFREWEKLDMSSMERRKLACSVTFHAVAFTCVIWSLYVLIDRSAEEYSSGQLQWPFWTKLVVVAIGFTGGVVFMYVQCTMYLTLCRRWRAYNRVILVQNAPGSRNTNNNPSTTVMLGDSSVNKSYGTKKNRKTSVPVQSVVTIASAFATGNVRGAGGKVGNTIDGQDSTVESEETEGLLDSKIFGQSVPSIISARPSSPFITNDDSIPSIQNL